MKRNDSNAALISGLFGLGGSLLGGLGSALSRPYQTAAYGRQAATLDDIAELLLGGGDYGGLKDTASQTLTAGQNAMDASLISRGIYNSGAALEQQEELSSNVLSGLASAINADQLARQGAAAQIYQNPSFQYWDNNTDTIQGGK